MRSLRSAFILFLSLAAILPDVSLAHPDSVLNKSFAERYDYVDSLRLYMIYNISDVEAGKKKLNEWISNAEKEDDEALAYQLKFSSLYLKQHINTVGEERKVLEQIEAALDDGYTLEAADGYYILSGWINSKSRRGKAMEYALLGYDLCKNLPIRKYPPKVKTLYRLAEWYYSYKEYRKTIDILYKLKEVERKPFYNIITGGELNTLALAYRELGYYDSAIYYFEQIYEDKQDKIRLTVRGIAAGNIGSIYQRRQNYQNAINWVNRELQLLRKENEEGLTLSFFSSYNGLADIYYSMGKTSVARKYVDSAQRIRYAQRSINALFKYYDIYSKILTVEGQYKQALVYKDSLWDAKQMMAEETNMSKLFASEKKVEESKHQLELNKLDTLRQKSIWIRNFAILLVVFTSVVLILLINRSRMKHKQRELELEHEKTKAEAKLAGFTLKMQEKNLQLIQLQEELTELSSEQDITAKNELIRQLQQSTILTDEQWEDFRNVFEQVHTGFIQRVREKHPDITPAELHYIVLVKLNMTNKEIANVLGISANSVRNYKFRLRRKFELSENDDLETLVKSL